LLPALTSARETLLLDRTPGTGEGSSDDPGEPPVPAERPFKCPRQRNGVTIVIEEKWASQEPFTMLNTLCKLATDRRIVYHLSGKALERKFRLFCCACCRLLLVKRPDEQCRAAVETIERYADGMGNRRELQAARRVAERAWETAGRSWGHPAELAVLAADVQKHLPRGIVPHGSPVEDVCQVALLHDLFGNPFRPVSSDFAWRSWGGGIVPDLAQTIYDSRCFADLPILSDALEEAGCSNADLLGHLRGGGPHVRGCWALDLLL
jgi:hypothetical protein